MKYLHSLSMLLVCASLMFTACDDGGDDTDNGGATPAGSTPAGMTPAGETPAGETPAGETPAGEAPAGETPAGEVPAGEVPAGETPAGEVPAGEVPAGEVPAGEEPAGETPAGEEPAGEEPAGETPAGEVSIGEGACSNDGDVMTLNDLGEAGLDQAIGGCVASCFIPGAAECGTCLGDATGLSETCTACFVEVTECTIANCVAQCASGPDSEACAECRVANCEEAFVECSGIEM